jgi:Asp-tRNA(Asn)/Glu-tRNA(Gln) amidotransferase A subunit family amidase
MNVEASLAKIDEREAELHAFAYVGADQARQQAAAVYPYGRLAGVTVGVKDVIDTADMPTEYGSPIYRGHQPRADAAAVALLRAAGAVVVGKTVTAELAWFTPGPTVNPHRATHTPGGSSSGSAAAVAAGMVDLALGTQTSGSVIRPASFCGVFGYKPSFGLVPTAGVKQAAPSLDTVGVLARTVEGLEAARIVLTRRVEWGGSRRVRWGLARTEQWDEADGDCRRVVERAGRVVDAEERDLPRELVGLAAEVPKVQAYEGVSALAWERTTCQEQLSEGLRGILEWGETISSDDYDRILRRAAAARSPRVVERLFGEANVLITPAVAGEAPEGLESTGDPRFCRLWTLLGLPTVVVPGQLGATGLPIGVQLVGRPNDDAHVIAAAGLLEGALS